MFDSIKAILIVQKLKKGSKENISKSQIVSIIINLSDASKNLSKTHFQEVNMLFREYKIDKSKFLVDYDGYIRMCNEIIDEFEHIAPFKYYNGEESKHIGVYTPIVNKKLAEIEKLEKSILIMINNLNDAREKSSGLTVERIHYLYKTNRISRIQMEQGIRDLETYNQMIFSYPSIIQTAKDLKEQLINDLESQEE